MPLDQFSGAIDGFQSPEYFGPRDRHGEALPIQRLDLRQRVHTGGARFDENSARPCDRPEMALQLAHRLEGFVTGPVLGATRHAAQQLVEHRQGGIGQAFLKTAALRRQRRMAAQGIEFAQVLGCDPAAFVRQPVKSQSRDHVGTGAIEIQRAAMSRSEEDTSEHKYLMSNTYAVFCFKKNKTYTINS